MVIRKANIMDIFENLENLQVSEACFNDIMDIVEEYISELYPANTKNIKKAYDRRVKQHSDNVKAHSKAYAKANKTYDDKRDAELAYQKASTEAGRSRRDLLNSLTKDSSFTTNQGIKKQGEIEANNKKLEKATKKLDDMEKKNEQDTEALHVAYDNKKKSGSKLENIERLIKNHLLIKNK